MSINSAFLVNHRLCRSGVRVLLVFGAGMVTHHEPSEVENKVTGEYPLFLILIYNTFSRGFPQNMHLVGDLLFNGWENRGHNNSIYC
jgi:hypothetical protein